MEEKTSDASTPHQIPRNTSSRNDERGDESFIETIKLCYLFTYHILKL